MIWGKTVFPPKPQASLSRELSPATELLWTDITTVSNPNHKGIRRKNCAVCWPEKLDSDRTNEAKIEKMQKKSNLWTLWNIVKYKISESSLLH